MSAKRKQQTSKTATSTRVQPSSKRVPKGTFQNNRVRIESTSESGRNIRTNVVILAS